ncbi:MAG: peptide ABC transporter substrate-binding protein [Chloroflexota bacterium]|nr:peptide ABC transporter substrate-binding protein [Chloroflexota bacterium]
MRGKSWWGAGLLCLVLLLVACDREDARTGPGPEPADTRPVATPTATEAPENPVVLRLAMRELKTLDPGLTMTLDPGLAMYPEALTLVDLLFEPLVRVDAEGRPQPAAAEKWEVAAGGAEYRFTLRPDLKWSDGSALTATDFEYAWKRVLDPNVRSDAAYLLFPVEGAMDYADGLSADADGVRIVAESERVLKVTLTEPTMTFPARVALWIFAPVKRSVLESTGVRWMEAGNLVGNGPYMLAEWEHGASMRLVRNPYFRDPSRQRVDEVAVTLMGADGSPAERFAAGKADIVELRGEDLNRARDDEELRRRSAVYDLAGNWFLVFNTQKAPWDDVRVRQAFSLALDRERLVGLVFEGTESPSLSLLPEPARSSAAPLSGAPQAGIDAARRLLAEAGFLNGAGFPTVRFTYHQIERWDRLAEYLQARWSEVLGVQVEIDRREWRDFLDFTVEPGDFDIYRAGWNAEYRDPQNWHNVLWHSGDDFLRSGWVDAAYDDLVAAADGERDPAARAAAYARADAWLDEQLPGIPLATRARGYLVGAGVEGIRVAPVGGYLVLDEVRLPER